MRVDYKNRRKKTHYKAKYPKRLIISPLQNIAIYAWEMYLGEDRITKTQVNNLTKLQNIETKKQESNKKKKLLYTEKGSE